MILSDAADRDADLIVMGGYGHSRFAGVRSWRRNARRSSVYDCSDTHVALTNARDLLHDARDLLHDARDLRHNRSDRTGTT